MEKMLGAIRAQESKVAALAKARDVVTTLREMKRKRAVKKAGDSAEETLTCIAFPFEHWTHLHANDVIERLSWELRRRTRVVGAFLDGNVDKVLL